MEIFYVLIEDGNFKALSDDKELIDKFIIQRNIKGSSEVLKISHPIQVETLYVLYNNLELENIGGIVLTCDEKMFLDEIIEDEVTKINLVIHQTKRIINEYRLPAYKIRAFKETIKHLEELKKHEYTLYCQNVQEYISSCTNIEKGYIEYVIF